MKAKNLSGQAPGGKRTKLSEVLPLQTPFVIQIFPIYACNFKCCYCIFSIDSSNRGFISDKVTMDFSLFQKVVDEMSYFPEQIKVLRFVGIGEPLLHKDISKMIAYASSKGVAKTIEILTNASLLTPKMSDELIAAGLNRMVISLQGTNKEDYKRISGIDINFDQFVDNIRYFYTHKGLVHLYVKVVDTALDGPLEERKFFDIFGDICDSIAIEHTVPIHSGVDYGNILDQKTEKLTQFGLPVSELKICPQPFFTMQINPDGKVVPCFSFEYPEIIGDCNKQTVTEIWMGKNFQRFRRKMLEDVKNVGEICAKCNIMKYRLFPEDDLSKDAEKLKKIYD